jgi:septal ring factor EnvC (AmiA/AmiB activator)
MEDFSDATNRSIILLLFIVFIFYLKYIETQLKIKKNVKNVKCNPIQMVVGSMIDSNNSSTAFEQCMRTSAQDVLAEYSSEQLSSQRQALENNIAELNQRIDENDKLNEKQRQKLREDIKNASMNMNQIVESQNEINNQLKNNVTSISDIATLAKDTISELSSALNSFKTSSLMKNLM